jgi:hypothetical protein
MLDVSQVTPEIEKWEEKVGKPEDGPTQSY